MIVVTSRLSFAVGVEALTIIVNFIIIIIIKYWMGIYFQGTQVNLTPHIVRLIQCRLMLFQKCLPWTHIP
jgi:disulfide bond formation protein DsbB